MCFISLIFSHAQKISFRGNAESPATDNLRVDNSSSNAMEPIQLKNNHAKKANVLTAKFREKYFPDGQEFLLGRHAAASERIIVRPHISATTQ